MFTGIIEAMGSIESITTHAEDSRFVFQTGQLDLSGMDIGESIAVNGACLTIIERTANTFSADVSVETLDLTCFKSLAQDAVVNLERAMQLSDRINGHLVSGHVDGVGKISSLVDDGRSVRYEIELPRDLTRFVSKKGSITVDGVSLTVNEVNNNIFSVNIIPYTMKETIFQHYQVGSHVNIEVDMLARYVAQLISK